MKKIAIFLAILILSGCAASTTNFSSNSLTPPAIELQQDVDPAKLERINSNMPDSPIIDAVFVTHSIWILSHLF